MTSISYNGKTLCVVSRYKAMLVSRSLLNRGLPITLLPTRLMNMEPMTVQSTCDT